MRMLNRLGSTAAALAFLIVLGGCWDDPTGPTLATNAVPEFTLQDVNPNSVSSGQPVNPRLYLGQVSAWYFGHST